MKQLNWYQIFGNTHTIPDGRTVTPTDDIQIWLNCADIWDKTYTTLAEVLADTDTLLALITSNNAVDYMVRSTTWAVAQALVPTMTSNTTPEGECIGRALYQSAYDYWKAFDRNTSTYAVSGNTTSSGGGDYIGYIFPEIKYVSSIEINFAYEQTTFKVQGTTDGVTWNDITENISGNIGIITRQIPGNYKGVRIYKVSSVGARFFGAYEIQFYSASITANADAMTYIGQNNYAANTLLADATWREAICSSEYFESVLNASIPKMTSNTTPKGIASTTSVYSSAYDAYTAFKGNEISSGSDYGWATASGVRNADLKYQTDADSSFKPIFMKASRPASNNTNFVFYGSNDGNTYTDLLTVTAMTTYTVNAYVIQNDVEYGYFKWSFSSSENLSDGSGIKIRLYGRKDV